MSTTYFASDALDAAPALLAALLIGVAFGVSLERAGFGSARRLSGIFYFRDMAVLKTMFSGVVTAMIGVVYLLELRWISLDQLHLLPTRYPAQIAGGLLFGIGFAIGGWCPGTAAVGLASGKLDAAVYLAGALAGSVLFNQAYPIARAIHESGGAISFAYDVAGLPRAAFAALFVLVAVAAFWAAELVERLVAGTGEYLGSRFLAAYSVALVLLATGLFAFAAAPPATSPTGPSTVSAQLGAIDEGRDHIEPEDLADRLMAGDPSLAVLDVRPASEFRAFHIRGAQSVALSELPAALARLGAGRTVVLYSNGMTHPAQAREALVRLGFPHVLILTDGLTGFVERCLKPVSLRPGRMTAADADRVRAWRAYYGGGDR